VGEILRELQGQYSGICLITPVQYSWMGVIKQILNLRGKGLPTHFG
jgi:hypothetical protein